MTMMTSQRRGRSRRRLLATAAGTLGGLVAAACGPLRPAAPPSDKTAEIRLSVWGDIQDWDVYAAMTSDFNAAQQRVRVTPEQYKGFNYYKTVQGGLPYDVVSMPKGTVWRPLHEQNGHTMSAQTKQPEAAWDLLKWVAGDQGQRRIAEGGRMGNLPETNEKIWAPIAMPKYNFKNLAAWLNTQRNGEIHIAGITQAQVWDPGLKQTFDGIAKGRKGAKEKR